MWPIFIRPINLTRHSRDRWIFGPTFLFLGPINAGQPSRKKRKWCYTSWKASPICLSKTCHWIHIHTSFQKKYLDLTWQNAYVYRIEDLHNIKNYNYIKEYLYQLLSIKKFHKYLGKLHSPLLHFRIYLFFFIYVFRSIWKNINNF